MILRNQSDDASPEGPSLRLQTGVIRKDPSAWVPRYTEETERRRLALACADPANARFYVAGILLVRNLDRSLTREQRVAAGAAGLLLCALHSKAALEIDNREPNPAALAMGDARWRDLVDAAMDNCRPEDSDCAGLYATARRTSLAALDIARGDRAGAGDRGQSPPIGGHAAPASLAQELCTVPDVSGLTPEQAAHALLQQGLLYSFSLDPAAHPFAGDRVARQEPTAYSQVRQGTAVRVFAPLPAPWSILWPEQCADCEVPELHSLATEIRNPDLEEASFAVRCERLVRDARLRRLPEQRAWLEYLCAPTVASTSPGDPKTPASPAPRDREENAGTRTLEEREVAATGPERAIGLLVSRQEERWTLTALAKASGCSRRTLGRNPEFTHVWNAYSEKCKGDPPPRGEKDGETGDVEATSYDDEA